jgi:hypothetical protein
MVSLSFGWWVIAPPDVAFARRAQVAGHDPKLHSADPAASARTNQSSRRRDRRAVDGLGCACSHRFFAPLLTSVLARHPRFFVYLGIALVVLIIVGLLLAKFSGKAP